MAAQDNTCKGLTVMENGRLGLDGIDGLVGLNQQETGCGLKEQGARLCGVLWDLISRANRLLFRFSSFQFLKLQLQILDTVYSISIVRVYMRTVFL